MPFLDGIDEVDEITGLQILELCTFLPDHLLLYADKLSMAHGLEVRVPYLDHEVVEFALGLPPTDKIRWGRRKHLHREICRDTFPRHLLGRPKRNFGATVVRDWLRSTLQSQMTDVLRDPSSLIFRIMDHASVNGMLNEHQQGMGDHHKILHNIVVLEYWMRSDAVC